MAKSKIVFGNQVLMDLTSDTVDAQSLLVGKTAHGRDGEVIEGECTFDADTKDATATASEILDGSTAYVNGVKIVGAMTNREGVQGAITSKNEAYTIQSGYHDGSGYVEIDETERNKILPTNIKAGIEILGVTGTYGGEDAKIQSKEVTPKVIEQTVLPDETYDYLSQVKVNAIPYFEEPNAQGGITVTIAGE